MKLKIPLAGASGEQANIAAKHSVIIRSIQDGESDAANVVFEVANKRRLGVTEADSINDVLSAVLELVALDASLEASGSIVQPASLAQKKTRSLLARMLD